ncbi:hypothetical protein OFB93_29980, partial [Escherichia coli]|nr:hypothetical protein [Escherichia coli]
GLDVMARLAIVLHNAQTQAVSQVANVPVRKTDMVKVGKILAQVWFTVLLMNVAVVRHLRHQLRAVEAADGNATRFVKDFLSVTKM